MPENTPNIPVGVTFFWPDIVALYVIDADKNLVETVYKGDPPTWSSNSLGMPSASGIAGGIGVVANPNFSTQSAYAFVVGSDGILQCNISGSWASLGALPNGVTAVYQLGVAALESQIAVFVLGSDSNVWICLGEGGGQWNWNCLKVPLDQNGNNVSINVPLGVAGLFANSSPSLAVLGADGFVYSITGNSEYPVWQTFGAPSSAEIMEPIGVCYATADDGSVNGLLVAVIDTNNKVWQCDANLNSGVGIWTPLPIAQGLTPVMGIGIAYSYTMSLYVVSDDNTLWCYTENDWFPLGSPTAQISEPIGVIVGSEHRYTFLTDQNGVIWCNVSNFRQSSWIPVA